MYRIKRDFVFNKGLIPSAFSKKKTPHKGVFSFCLRVTKRSGIGVKVSKSSVMIIAD